ncbi:E3 ubiquitin-protein ligase mib2 [Plakobranchus ocellatus]|uniref:E3 ubiquitin-protein ligase mib2 n=1 Tax=Plakobranchus ocellatus TaxID=259542 RepID=A0AAV4CVW2_9GAST|nr:E3 ubiquitin-protein ligase mib2 [Plakobranchus ocellatus]
MLDLGLPLLAAFVILSFDQWMLVDLSPYLPQANQCGEEIGNVTTSLVNDRWESPHEPTEEAENSARSISPSTTVVCSASEEYNKDLTSVSWKDPKISQAGTMTSSPRDKKIIEIKDPSTGKDVTEELIIRAHAEHTRQKEKPAATKQGDEISKVSTHLVTGDTRAAESSVRKRVPPAPEVWSTKNGYNTDRMRDTWQGPKKSQAGRVTAYTRNKKIEINDPSTGEDITEKLTNIAYADHTAIEEVKDPLQNFVLPPQVVWSTHDGYSTGGVCAPWHGPKMSRKDHLTACPREKNIIAIKDPLTGIDVTEEVIDSVYADHTKAEKDPSAIQLDEDLRKIFRPNGDDGLQISPEDTYPVESPMGSLVPSSPLIWSGHDGYHPDRLFASRVDPGISHSGCVRVHPRDKMTLNIRNPRTGICITDELINSAHADYINPEWERAAKRHDEEIRKLFTRLVMDRLGKPSEHTIGAENLLGSTIQPTREFWLHTDAHIPNEINASWQDPRVSQSGHVTTFPRNKKIIEIKDPSTGKDVTRELINGARADRTKEKRAICHKLNLTGYGDQTGAAIACLLVQHGAELQADNKQVKTSLDITTVFKIEDLVKQFIATFAKKQEQSSKPSTATSDDCCTKSRLVTFHPCNHRVVCKECSTKLRKCIECKAFINMKKTADGRVIRLDELNQPEEAVVKKGLEEIEDKLISLICKERQLSRLFQCGPTTCSQCADSLPNYPACQQPIQICA